MRSSAVSNAGSVFSGLRPRAPRWPCRSKPTGRTNLSSDTATAVVVVTVDSVAGDIVVVVIGAEVAGDIVVADDSETVGNDD